MQTTKQDDCGGLLCPGFGVALAERDTQLNIKARAQTRAFFLKYLLITMTTEITISEIDRALISAFAMLDSWFDYCEPQPQSETQAQVTSQERLEYMVHSNRFLLTLIDKGEWTLLGELIKEHDDMTLFYVSPAAEEKVKFSEFDLESVCKKKHEVGCTLKEIRQNLRAQLYQCLCYLDTFAIKNNTAATRSVEVSHLYTTLRFIAHTVKVHASHLAQQWNQLA